METRKKELSAIAKEDGRYKVQAMRFVYEGLGYTVKNFVDEVGHVTGQTLCNGLKEFAMEKWGRLAMLVLNSWGVRTTRDLGEIVYLMIANKWMSAQPTDTIADFDDVYDFRTVFKEEFRF